MGCEIENVTIHYCDIVCGCYIIYLGKLHYLIIIHRMYSNVGNMLSKGWVDPCMQQKKFGSKKLICCKSLQMCPDSVSILIGNTVK